MLSDYLCCFVAFSGDQNTVARPCFRKRKFDGSMSVRLNVKAGETVWEASGNLFNDSQRFFRARVVAGDNGKVCPGSGLSQERPFGSVAVSAGSEDAQDATGGQ